MTIWASEIKELEKLHDSLKVKHPKLDIELQRLLKTDDENIVLVYARRCLEIIITDLCEWELKRPRGTEPLKGIIDKLNKEEKIPSHIIASMQNLNTLSTFGAHPKDFDPRQVKPVLLDLTTALEWYMKYLEAQSTADAEPGVPGEIRKDPAGAKKVTASSKKQILLASVILLVCAVIVVALILTDVISGGKGVKAGEIKSLVVLPFENYTGIDSLEYFVDGMHSSLITDMGKISSLLIPGKTTSKTFKNADRTIAQIASELHVDAALETDVLCLGDSICLQVRLVQPGKEEKQLWVADYREDKSQILNLYNRITRQIADEIMIELTPEEERLLTKTRTIEREVYDAYLRSYQYWDDLSGESLNKARDYLNSAIEKDPDWAPLYTGLANVWMGLTQQGFEPPSIAYPVVYECLNKALELDPDHPDTHYIIAMTAWLNQWDWAKAEKEFLKALAGNPNDALSRMWYAHLICILHRPDEALTQAQLAFDLDPLNPFIQLLFSATLLHAGDCENAQASAEKILADDPDNFIANQLLNLAAFRCGHYEKVIISEKNQLQVHSGNEFDEAAYKEIERIFKEQDFSAAYEKIILLWEELAINKKGLEMVLALAYLKGNKHNKAVDMLEKAYENRDPGMPYIGAKCYSLEPLHDNPRFIAILEKMNLPLPDK